MATTKLAPVLNHLSEHEKWWNISNARSYGKIKQTKKLQQSNNNKTLVQKLGR